MTQSDLTPFWYTNSTSIERTEGHTRVMSPSRLRSVSGVAVYLGKSLLLLGKRTLDT